MSTIKIKITILSLAIASISGCASTSYHDRNLDTLSNMTKPSENKAGIYVYQVKSGIIGAAVDASFSIKGQPEVTLNTGEYAYFEIPPGEYEYRLSGGLFQNYIPFEARAGQNYFFAASMQAFRSSSNLVIDQRLIDEAKNNIKTGRYELNTVD